MPPVQQSRSTMRAIVFDGANVSLETRHEAPNAGLGEAVVRTQRALVTRTDVNVARGLHHFTGVLGHAFVGTVEHINSDDNHHQNLINKRVVGSAVTFCSECDMCAAGLRDHCRKRTILGMVGRDGCLAERFVLPAENLVAVPDAIDDDHAPFVPMIAAAVQAARQLTIEGKPYITVLGDGPVGLITAQIMATLNASVRIIGRYPDKMAICEKWSIKHRHVDDIGRRADQDVVVDCTGSPSGLPLAMQLVRPRGTIVLKTMLPPSAIEARPIDFTPVVDNELQIIGSSTGPINEALALLEADKVDVINLISRRMRLDDGPAILQTVAKPETMTVLVDTR